MQTELYKPIEGEIWMPMNNYVGFIEISNFGRVKSFGRITDKNSKAYIRTPSLSKSGYYHLRIGFFKLYFDFFVHRIVAEHFIPNPENKPEVNHIDGNPLNNHVSNLEWVTRSENMLHAVKTGLKKIQTGVQCANSKLSERLVLEIFNSTLPVKELSKKYQVAQSSIYRIKSGRDWSHLTGMKKKITSRQKKQQINVDNAPIPDRNTEGYK